MKTGQANLFVREVRNVNLGRIFAFGKRTKRRADPYRMSSIQT